MKKGFSVDNFKKKKDEPTSVDEVAGFPYWVDESKPKIVALYQGVETEFQRIKDFITTGEELTLKQRQIIKTTVCAHADVVKSYLRADRSDTKKIIDLITEKNEYLAELWGKKHSLKRKSGSKLLRSELEAQNKQLKSEFAVLEKGLDKEYFQQWVDLFLVNDSKRMVKKISDLQMKIDSLHEENIELKAEIRKLRKEKFQTVK
ncbi:hypothetical protein ACFL19_00030 [Pseudomonadota bacterium]